MVRRSKENGPATFKVASAKKAPTHTPGTNGSSKGIPKDSASPNTNYGQYLGSLATKLDRVARIPKQILGGAIKLLFYSSVAGIFTVAITIIIAGDGNNKLEAMIKPMFVSKTPWHSGAEWAEFLSLYDASVAENLGHCQHRHLPTRYGLTMVHVCGNAEDDTVLLFHGAQATSTMWDVVVNHAELPRRRRLVLVDHICDKGRSIPLACPMTTNDHVGWFEDIYTGLGVTKADLVGHSYGAFVTGLVAVAAPEMVKEMVHLAPGAVYAPTTLMFRMCGMIVYFGTAFPSLGLDGTWFQQRTTSPSYNVYAHNAELGISMYKAAFAVPLQHFLKAPHQFSDTDLARLAKNNVTLIYPEYEVVTDRQTVFTRAAAANIPVILAEGVGHALRLERPEWFADTITKLLLE